MKNIMCKYFSLGKLAFIFAILLTAILTFTIEANAQVRHGRGMRGGGFVHVPSHSIGIQHGYYFGPRIGARFRALPFGYTTFWIGGIPYYYYDGFYYQYFPEDEVYVVVEKPKGADTVQSLKFDHVKLYDGSILEGVFEGATDSSVTLQIGNDDHDIKISDIVSITFAPSIQDSTQVK